MEFLIIFEAIKQQESISKLQIEASSQLQQIKKQLEISTDIIKNPDQKISKSR